MEPLSAPFYFVIIICMKSKPASIEFYYPNKLEARNKKRLVNILVELMKEKGSLGYSGYHNENDLRKEILLHMGSGNMVDYTLLDTKEERKIRKEIEMTIRKCNAILPIPTKNHVFVFSYIPDKDENVFGGVMGYAPYSCVFHLFISPKKYTVQSLAHTVAHELNHTIFYYNHYHNFNNYTLLEHMIIEGLAENFRESVFGGEPAPWSIAIEQESALEKMESLKEVLSSTDEDIRHNVLFGDGKKYKKWFGYSLGYWMIKRFIEKNKRMSWENIMKKDSKEILNNFTK